MHDFSNASLKNQLEEYHLMLAEILGGIDDKLTSLASRVEALEGLDEGSESDRVTKMDLRIVHLELSKLLAQLDDLQSRIAALEK